MKSLQDYREKAQTQLFAKTGAFFAFSTKQFEEQKKEGVKYVSCGAGMVCPKESVKELSDGIEKIGREAREKDLKENGKENIIIRELYDYESFYTGEIDSARDALTPYGITTEEIVAAYRKEYPNYEKHNI